MSFFFLMIRRPPRSTPLYSSAASEVYKGQTLGASAILELLSPWCSGFGGEEPFDPAQPRVASLCEDFTIKANHAMKLICEEVLLSYVLKGNEMIGEMSEFARLFLKAM